MKKYNIAIVGATGAVGQQILTSLEKINFPVNNLVCFGSSRSVGKKIIFNDKVYFCKELFPNCFQNIDIAFFSAGSAISREFVPKAVLSGAICIDNTSEFRMNEDVPLVVPEVNINTLQNHAGIIANPNCATIQLAVVLEPLRKLFGLKRIIVSTYQAVSGVGKTAIDELLFQSLPQPFGNSLEAKVLPAKSANNHFRIAYNCLAQVDQLTKSGYSIEELKIISELKKILSDKTLEIGATCVRVPVVTGHSESVYLEFDSEVSSVDKVRECLENADGVVVVDDWKKQKFPQPLMCQGKNEVFVGRIRKDLDKKNAVHLWIVADNLLKGAAWNSVQIAQALTKV